MMVTGMEICRFWVYHDPAVASHDPALHVWL